MANPGATSAPAFSRARVDRLRIRHLRLLELIVKTGSLTGAGAALNISQPAATKILQELELAFGCTLLDRTSRGSVLSGSGERAMERLKIILGLLDAAEDEFAGLSQAPFVRIGVLRLAGISLIPNLVSALRLSGKLPRIRLYKGSVSVLSGMLNDGAVDCIIGRLDVDEIGNKIDDFDITLLTDEHYQVACAPTHPLAGKSVVDLSALLDFPWVIPFESTYTRRTFERAFLSKGIPPPTPHIESSSFHDSIAILAQTDFLTLAPRSAIAYYTDLGRVQKLNLADPFPVDYVVLIALKSVATMASMKLIKSTLLQQVANAHD